MSRSAQSLKVEMCDAIRKRAKLQAELQATDQLIIEINAAIDAAEAKAAKPAKK